MPHVIIHSVVKAFCYAKGSIWKNIGCWLFFFLGNTGYKISKLEQVQKLFCFMPLKLTYCGFTATARKLKNVGVI